MGTNTHSILVWSRNGKQPNPVSLASMSAPHHHHRDWAFCREPMHPSPRIFWRLHYSTGVLKPLLLTVRKAEFSGQNYAETITPSYWDIKVQFWCTIRVFPKSLIFLIFFSSGGRAIKESAISKPLSTFSTQRNVTHTGAEGKKSYSVLFTKWGVSLTKSRIMFFSSSSPILIRMCSSFKGSVFPFPFLGNAGHKREVTDY